MVALGLPLATSEAQRMLQAGLGVGANVGDRLVAKELKGDFYGQGFVELHIPAIPLGARVDALLSNAGRGGGPLAIAGSAVFAPRIPVVQPYVLAGWGTYGVGREGSSSGWNAGGGLRLASGPIRLYGEYRRHQRLAKDVFTVGLTF